MAEERHRKKPRTDGGSDTPELEGEENKPGKIKLVLKLNKPSSTDSWQVQNTPSTPTAPPAPAPLMSPPLAPPTPASPPPPSPVASAAPSLKMSGSGLKIKIPTKQMTPAVPTAPSQSTTQEDEEDEDDGEGGAGNDATPKEKKYIPFKKALNNLLTQLIRKDHYGMFYDPVRAEEAPGYFDIIKHPMDFTTMRKRLSAGEYRSLQALVDDFELLCNNCTTYNAPDTVYHQEALNLLAAGRGLIKKTAARIDPSRLKGDEPLPPSAPPRASASTHTPSHAHAHTPSLPATGAGGVQPSPAHSTRSSLPRSAPSSAPETPAARLTRSSQPSTPQTSAASAGAASSAAGPASVKVEGRGTPAAPTHASVTHTSSAAAYSTFLPKGSTASASPATTAPTPYANYAQNYLKFSAPASKPRVAAPAMQAQQARPATGTQTLPEVTETQYVASLESYVRGLTPHAQEKARQLLMWIKDPASLQPTTQQTQPKTDTDLAPIPLSSELAALVLTEAGTTLPADTLPALQQLAQSPSLAFLMNAVEPMGAPSLQQDLDRNFSLLTRLFALQAQRDRQPVPSQMPTEQEIKIMRELQAGIHALGAPSSSRPGALEELSGTHAPPPTQQQTITQPPPLLPMPALI